MSDPIPPLRNADDETNVSGSAPDLNSPTRQPLLEPAQAQKLEEGLNLHLRVMSALANEFHIVHDGRHYECTSTEGLPQLNLAFQNAEAEQKHQHEVRVEALRIRETFTTALDEMASKSTLTDPQAMMDKFKDHSLKDIDDMMIQNIVNIVKTSPRILPDLQHELQELHTSSCESMKPAHESNLILTKRIEQLESAQSKLFQDAASHYVVSKALQARIDTAQEELSKVVGLGQLTFETMSRLRRERTTFQEKYERLCTVHADLQSRVELKDADLVKAEQKLRSLSETVDSLRDRDASTLNRKIDALEIDKAALAKQNRDQIQVMHQSLKDLSAAQTAISRLQDAFAPHIRQHVMAVKLENFTVIADATGKMTVCDESNQIAVIDRSRISLATDEMSYFHLVFKDAPLIGSKNFVVSNMVVYEKLNSLLDLDNLVRSE